MPPTFPHLKTGHERVVKKSGKICTIRTSTGIMSKKHRYYILNNKTKASADTPLRPPTGQEECIQLTLCAQDINHFEFAATTKGIVDITEKNKNCLYLHGAPNSGKSLTALSVGLTFKKFIDIGNIASIFKFQSAVIRDVSYLKK